MLDALNDYEGAVILITHDRSLMELVADRLWLAAGGTIKPFDGDMNDYARFVLDKARMAARAPTQVAAEPAPTPVSPPHPTGRDPVAQAGPLKRKLEAAEAVLARETRAVSDLDAILADPALYTRDPARAAEVGRKRAKQQEALDRAEALWMAAAGGLRGCGCSSGGMRPSSTSPAKRWEGGEERPARSAGIETPTAFLATNARSEAEGRRAKRRADGGGGKPGARTPPTDYRDNGDEPRRRHG